MNKQLAEEMEKTAAGPRVFVPIALPDSGVQTYAVLEFLGFSSSSPLALPYHHPSSSSFPPLTTNADLSPKDIREHKDRKLVPLKAAPMKKSCSASITPLSPGAKRALTGVSVSQTERDTIVHTSSSNFREVVRQLTGASSEDQDLLPVTLPARYGGKIDVAMAKSENGSGCKDLGPRRSALKLHERRKAMRNLEKLCTGQRELPPLVPSPVTPLASDFEKFCLPTTPTTSQGSGGVSPTGELKVIGESALVINQQLGIAEKGFYVHPERPNNTGPTLLNLFPESPACSPRDI